MNLKKSTLFVRNLPYTVSNEHLEEVFSQYGPIKRCFVVTEHGKKTNRGFGYVTFSLESDAQKTLLEKVEIDGRKLRLSISDKRILNVKEIEIKKDVIEKTPKKSYEKKHQLCLGNLPKNLTLDQLETAINELKGMKNVEYEIETPIESTIVHINFKSTRNSIIALNVLKALSFNGQKIFVETKAKEKKLRTLLNPKSARLIIRNISFKCNENQLKEAFSCFGEIVEILIAKKDDGKLRGFAFIQFNNLQSAAKALTNMNGKKLNGRQIAVDFSLSKQQYEKSKALQNNKDSITAFKSVEDTDLNLGEKPTNNQNDSDECDNSDSKFIDSESEMIDNDENDCDSDINIGDEVDGDEEEEDDDDEMNKNSIATGNNIINNDIFDGKTVFIRKLPLTSDEEDVKELFLHFGKICYVKIVTDKDTQHSKGIGFVKFFEKSAADKCINTAKDKSDNGGIFMENRELTVDIAISKTDIEKLHSQKKEDKKKTDKRNLWLAREGMIRGGTASANGVSSNDMTKRIKIENLKRAKLKDPNVFVSTTRLCFHNLPVSLNDQALKQLILKHLKDKAIKINECRIMRDLQNVDSSGLGRSRGYAFVNFIEHEHALKVLRYFNNNPDIFSKTKRPIVEFSLENKAKLLARDKRRLKSIEKSKDKQSTGKTHNKKIKKVKTLSTDSSKTPIEQKKIKGSRILPKKSGIKLRHKPRETHDLSTKNKKRVKEKRVRAFLEDSRLLKGNRPKSEKNKKRHMESDKFDEIVNKYKKAMLTNTKWFSQN